MQQMRQIREMIALIMLTISAYTDIKERNIYIMPLVISSAGAVSISVTAYLCAPVGSKTGILVREIMLPLLAGVLVIAAVKGVAAYMGAGDGYLMAALGLVTGVAYCIYTVTAGLIVAAVYAAAMIPAGRKKPGGSIPFAPFVLTGFMAVLINEI